MTTTPLLIRVHDVRTGVKKTQGFSHSPVRLGRNKLNELVLDSQFVSQWHAVVRFDDAQTVFVDLGSTNGTLIENKRLDKNVELPVDERTEICIGDLRLRFARAAIPRDVQISQRSTTFLLHAQPTQIGKMPDVANARTRMLDTDDQTDAAPLNAPTPQEMAWFNSVSDHIRPLHDAAISGHAQLLKHMEHYLSQAPQESRTRLLGGLIERYPFVTRGDGYNAMLERLQIDPAALGEVDIEAWLNRIVFGSPVPPPNSKRLDKRNLLERIGATLEAFGQSYVDLRTGYRQFTSEIAVQSAADSQGLSRATDARRVLAYLFDPSGGAQNRIDELTRSFADMAIHQVALVSGVVEGMRGVLALVSPQAAMELPADAQVPQPTGMMAMVQGPAIGAAWKRYVQTHQGLLEGDRFTRELFGKAFAKAYYAVTGEKLGAQQMSAVSTGAQRAIKP